MNSPTPITQRYDLALVARICLQRPRSILLLGLALALASIALTASRLDFKTNRQDLLDPRSEFHQRWLEYVDEFGANADVVVVIEGADPSRVTAAIDDVGQALRGQPESFGEVFDRFPAERLLAKGMYYLPPTMLTSLERYVERAVAQVNNPQVKLTDLLALADPLHGPGAASVEALPVGAATAQAPAAAASLKARLGQQFPGYLLAQEGRLGLVLARLVAAQNGFVPDAAPFRTLERLRQQLQLSHPEVSIGLTGLPLLEYAEMQTSQQDMTWASVLSVVAVTALMWAGFGGLKFPLLGMGSLLMGVAWSWGYLTLAVGHLNILSMSFGVILIGLGIDFSIHFLAGYLELRQRGGTVDDALLQTARQAGPPILAGGVTTAAAFFATSVTPFRGVAELGVIAGGGVLLCVAATLLMLPCAIHWAERRRTNASDGLRLLALEAGLRPLWCRPRRTITLFTLGTLALATGLTRLSYDHNLLNLQADGVSSVAWEKRLLEHTDHNSWFAVSMTDSLDETRRRKHAFEQLDSVARVEELASLLPVATPQQCTAVGRLHASLQAVPESAPVLEPISLAAAQGDLQQLDQHQRPLSTASTKTDPENLLRQLNAQRTLAAEQLWKSLVELRELCDPRPPRLEDLPTELRARFVGGHGKHLLRVFARENIWAMEPLRRFVRQVEQVDPRITGDPIQTYYASRQMKSSYIRAAWLAAVAVGLILVLDLRQAGDVLLAALPTGLGIVQLFGLMGLLGIPLNAANIIVLPLIIGIGIDDGIHVLHHHRRSGPDAELSRSTLAGIVLTSLTSMIGFGSLMLARHEGLRSLGRVVTLGIACCLLTSVVLLPCLLRCVGRRQNGGIPAKARASLTA